MSDTISPPRREDGSRLAGMGSARLAVAAAGVAARCLGPLLFTAALPIALAGSIASALTLPIVGSSASLVNGQLVPVSTGGIVAIVIVRWTAYLLALVLALAAALAVATGCLAGQPVRVRDALDLVARRLPRLLPLAGAVCLIPLAVVAIAIGWWIIPPSSGVLSVLLLLPIWVLVGLPVVLFEGRSGLAWVSRLTLGRDVIVVVTLVAILALLALLAGAAAIDPLPPFNEIAAVLLLAAVSVGASALAAVFLGRPRGGRAGPGATDRWLAGCVPSPTGRRAVLVPVALALSLLPTASSFVVSTLAAPSLTRLQVQYLLPGQDPDSDVRMALAGDRPLIAVDRVRAASTAVLVLCANSACTSSSLLHVGGAAVSTPALTSVGRDRAAVVFWQLTPDNPPRWRLLLLTCRASGCNDVGRAPVLLSELAEGSSLRASIAVAPTPTGGVVVADVSGPPGGIEPLRLVSCADLRCERPVVTTTAASAVPAAITGYAPLAIAVRQDGRPVIASLDRPDGVLRVRSCSDPACRDFTLATPETVSGGVPFFGSTPARLSLVLLPDGLPALSLPSARTAAALLVLCRTPDCGQASTQAVSGPLPWITGPALTVGPAGLPLVAFRDSTVPGISVVGCADSRCARPVSRLRFGPAAGLEGTVDVAVGSDGIPRAVWSDSSGVLLLTCRTPSCG